MLLRLSHFSTYYSTFQKGIGGLSRDPVRCIALYKKIYGNTLIPTNFVIPIGDSNWPSNLQGISLGKMVRNLRGSNKNKKLSEDMIRQLNELDFIWNIGEYRWRHIILPALTIYNSKYKSSLVPSNFIIPDSKIWPSQMHGFALGKLVRNIRSSKVYIKNHPEREMELNKLGFSWDHQETFFTHKLIPALKVFKKLYGNLFIHCEFVVPCETLWPQQTWNMKLGEVVRKIRNDGNYTRSCKARQKILNELGFIWDHYDSYFKLVILPALKTYKSIQGSIKIPSDFIVPWEAPWPKESWDLRLGLILSNIRFRGDYVRNNNDRRQQLEKLGIVFQKN